MKPGLILITALLGGCSTYYNQQSLSIDQGQIVALMPVTNYSQTPLAGEKAETLIRSLWSQEKDSNLLVYPAQQEDQKLPLLFDNKRFKAAESWLQQQNADYYLTGTVNEWHYKAGLDAEPAVGITLSLYSYKDKKVVWSGTAARAGWSRESVTSTAHKVIDELLEGVEFR